MFNRTHLRKLSYALGLLLIGACLALFECSLQISDALAKQAYPNAKAMVVAGQLVEGEIDVDHARALLGSISAQVHSNYMELHTARQWFSRLTYLVLGLYFASGLAYFFSQPRAVAHANQTLSDGERIVHEAAISLWHHWPLLTLGVLTLPIYGLGLVGLLGADIARQLTSLSLSNQRLFVKLPGSRKVFAVEQIQSIELTQSNLGERFDFGTLVIRLANGEQITLGGIQHPHEVIQHIESSKGAMAHSGRIPGGVAALSGLGD